MMLPTLAFRAAAKVTVLPFIVPPLRQCEMRGTLLVMNFKRAAKVTTISQLLSLSLSLAPLMV